MKKLILPSCEVLLHYFHYNAEEGKLYWKNPNPDLKGYKNLIGKEAGNIHDGYRRVMIDGKKYQTHCIIYFLETGKQPKIIDHRDRNSLNNKFGNLRASSHSRNMRNTGKNSHNTTGYKGVRYYKKTNKWFGQSDIKDLKFTTNHFDYKCQAAKAYDNKLIEQYNQGLLEDKPFLNFPVLDFLFEERSDR